MEKKYKPCNKCGHEILASAKFCDACGNENYIPTDWNPSYRDRDNLKWWEEQGLIRDESKVKSISRIIFGWIGAILMLITAVIFVRSWGGVDCPQFWC